MDVNFTLTGTPAFVAMFVAMLIPVIVVAFVFGNLSRFAHRKRQFAQNTVVAEYEPPAGLSPAEVGYLFDNRLGNLEMTATLIDLEQKELVKLANDGSGITAAPTGAPAPSDLLPHEQYVLSNLTAQTNMDAFELTKTIGFGMAVRKSLTQRGLIRPFTFGYVGYVTARVLVTYVAIFVPMTIILSWLTGGNILMAVLVTLGLAFFGVPFFLGLALFGGLVYNRIAGQPGLWGPKLKQLWPEIAGYRDYVALVELDRLKFESDELKEQSKNHALPYAMALGMHTDWQKRFGA